MKTTLTELARDARANSERWFPHVHDPHKATCPLAVHYALGMCGEAGEVANVIKKGLREVADIPPDNTWEFADTFALTTIGYELADVFTYLLLLADECGVDLETAYMAKRAVCEERWG